MRCWQCGAQVLNDERYCPECFAEIEEEAVLAAEGGEPVICPGCGTHCDPADSTCPACGSPLDAGLAPEGDEDE